MKKGDTVEMLNFLKSSDSPLWFSEFFPLLIPNFFGGALLGRQRSLDWLPAADVPNLLNHYRLFKPGLTA